MITNAVDIDGVTSRQGTGVAMPPEGRTHHVFSTPDTAPWINRGKDNLCNSRELGK